MGKDKIKPHQRRSDIQQTIESRPPQHENGLFVVSFKNLDESQANSLVDWDSEGILAQAIQTIAGYCQRPLEQQFSDKFTIYGEYPTKSKYTRPRHVPKDANWARIHVNGKQILAGHVFQNTFYVVFLDPDHSFYPTEKKNT